MAASSSSGTSDSIINVTVFFHGPTDLGQDQRICKQISCNEPSQNLLDRLKNWCSEYRARQSHLPWDELGMDAEILLEDERNVYLNHKLGSGTLRFEHIYDMFRGAKDTASLCIVVDIKEKEKLPDNRFMGDSRYRKMTGGEDPAYFYHRIAVETPPASNEDSQHDPMFRALIARYVKDKPIEHMELRETYQRPINGHIMGSPHLGRVVGFRDLLGDGPLRLDWLTKKNFKTQYQLTYEARNETGLWKQLGAIADYKEDDDERDIPVLPSMTFQDLNPKAGAEKLGSNDDDGIHVAVRLVNRLDTLVVDGMLSDDVWLPMNVLLRVEWDNDSGKQVRKLIYDRLRQVATLDPEERLNRVIQKGKWKLELWAMPQCKGKDLEQLHRFRDKERLKMWMDPAMVKEGNRKLYIEGHLVYRKSLEEQQGEE